MNKKLVITMTEVEFLACLTTAKKDDRSVSMWARRILRTECDKNGAAFPATESDKRAARFDPERY